MASVARSHVSRKTKPSRRAAAGAMEVTRHVPAAVQCLLWGRAAGRCEFAGCNKPLWKSSLTQERVNIAQKAHIYSFSANGPRGNRGIARDRLNDVANLLLACHQCHRQIDSRVDGGRYEASLLQQMKAEHEQRIEVVTGIAADKRSHVLLYGANVGLHGSPLNYHDAAAALFPHRYPASDVPLELTTVNSSFSDRDAAFWMLESENLRRKFEQRVRQRLATGDLRHLSVFAIAPQPLLILLGSLLGDIVSSDVYQRHREPPSWKWPPEPTTEGFEIHAPSTTTGTPALVLALSATITPDRVAAILGADASIWMVTMPSPHNDSTKSRQQLAEFRVCVRSLLNQIKAAHGQATTLHVFPAASAALATELGRIRMPKADMPWQIYDQVNALGGFIPALSLSNGA